MDSEKVIKRDNEYVLHTYNRNPIVLEKGHGLRAAGPEGQQYLDFTSGIGVNSLGYCDLDWAEAVSEQAHKLQHTSNLYYTAPCGKLAKKLCKRTGMSKVFFGNSGAEANEGAIKAARKYSVDHYRKDRTTVITLVNSFHGRTIATLTATGQEVFHNYFGPFNEGFVYTTAGDIEGLRELVDRHTCAIMLELIQGEGGVRPASQEFLQGLRDLCDEKGILLMFDEVQVGSGRTGKLFAHQNYGVEPDTCSMAKALGSGVPIGAVCARGDAAKTLTPGTHGSTFAGGPLACALAATTLDVMINEGVIENARVMGEYFRDQMHKVIEKNHPKAVNEIRGLGMINGIQLNHPSGQPVVDLCFQDNKVLINNTNGNVLRFVPPLITGKEEIDLCIKAVDDAMTKLGW